MSSQMSSQMKKSARKTDRLQLSVRGRTKPITRLVWVLTLKIQPCMVSKGADCGSFDVAVVPEDDLSLRIKRTRPYAFWPVERSVSPTRSPARPAPVTFQDKAEGKRVEDRV